VLSLLRTGFRGSKPVPGNRKGIAVRFADQSLVVVTSQKIGGRPLLPDSDSSRFAAVYAARWPDVEVKALASPASVPPQANAEQRDKNSAEAESPAHEIAPMTPEGSGKSLMADRLPRLVEVIGGGEATAAPGSRPMLDRTADLGLEPEAKSATPTCDDAQPGEIAASSEAFIPAALDQNANGAPPPDTEDALLPEEDEVSSDPATGDEYSTMPDIDLDDIQDHEARPTSTGFDFGEP